MNTSGFPSGVFQRLARFLLTHPLTSSLQLLAWNRLVRPYLLWRNHDFQITTAYGFKFSGNTVDSIPRNIFYFDIWEPNISGWIVRRLTHGDTFVDVGANLGWYSLLASHLVGPQGAVVAIEASKSVFDGLKHNVALNAATNIRLVHVAAWDCEAELPLLCAPPNRTGQSTLMESKAGGDDGQRGVVELVKALPLSAILSPQERSRSRIIKVDVEGAEYQVLKGLVGCLADFPDTLEITMEIDPESLAEQGLDVDQFLRPLRAAGFNVYRFENDYRHVSYLQFLREGRLPQAPYRFEGPFTGLTDIVLSRLDQASL